MAIIAIQFHGADLEDVVVYRSSLYAWTFEQRLRIYAIADVEAALERADPVRGRVAAYWLFHAKGFGARENQRTLAAEQELPEAYSLDLDLSSVPYREMAVAAEAGSVLDMLAYYDTLYLASDGGLLAVDVSARAAMGDIVPADRILKDPCISANAGLGAVAASCGRQGLHILFDSFDPESRRGRKVSDISLRAELGSATVVNHLSRSELQFFSGDTVTRPRVRGKILSEVRASTIDDETRQRLGENDDRSTDFTLWDQSRLVVFDEVGVQSVGISRTQDERGISRSRHLYESPVSQTVLSACRVGTAFVAETEDGLTLMRHGERKTELPTGPVIGLRSYQRSLRYLNLATATAEQGLWLIGFSSMAADDAS